MKPANYPQLYTKLYRKMQPHHIYPIDKDSPGRTPMNSLACDNTCARYMLYGGADSSIGIFDLESKSLEASILPKSAHQFGVSHIAWWLQDNGMFVSGSFDATLSLWDTDNLEAVYSFDLEHKIYNFDLNLNGIVACALDHPYIKLLDTRSGSQSHVLRGHQGRNLSCKWSPHNEYLLASAGSDGTVKLWDIRQSSPLVECLDMNRTTERHQLEPLTFRKSHRSSVNGLLWVPTGDRLVSVGNDNKVRVWNLNIEGGLNEGLNFGPQVQNKYLQNNDPCLSPVQHKLPGMQLLVNVDSGVVLMYDLNTAKLTKRLIPLSGANSSRQTCTIARKFAGVEFYSGDGEGNITEWACFKQSTDDITKMIERDNIQSVEEERRGPKSLADFIGG